MRRQGEGCQEVRRLIQASSIAPDSNGTFFRLPIPFARDCPGRSCPSSDNALLKQLIADPVGLLEVPAFARIGPSFDQLGYLLIAQTSIGTKRTLAANEHVADGDVSRANNLLAGLAESCSGSARSA